MQVNGAAAVLHAGLPDQQCMERLSPFSNCKCMPDLMKLHFLQPVPFQETGEKLPVCSRLGWLCLSREEIVILIFRVKLLDDVHEK